MKREILLSPACRAPQLWGYAGEKDHSRIIVKLPEDIAGCKYYRAEITIKGKMFRTDYLEILEGKVCFELTAAMVEASGAITAQVIGYVVDDNGDIAEIGKTEIYKGNIKKSLSGKLTSADSESGLLDRILAKLHALREKIHEHANKAILVGFKLISGEDPFYGGIDSNDLKHNGRSLRFSGEGAVIKLMKEVERDGRKFLRLFFNWGNEPQYNTETERKDYVDIPVDALINSSASEGGLTLNGSELDLGLGSGGGIKTVELFSDLPTDAKENDVAIVESEEYIRTENKTVVLPIEVKLPDEGQEIPNIYSFHFKDRFNSVLDSDELKSYNAGALSVNIESGMRSIMYVDISSKLAPMMANVEHPVLIAGVMDGEESMHFYIAGLSVRDFLQLMMELELEEEQWAVLLGSHANDSSEDEPVYGWVNLVTSTEPINDNSLEIESGMYGTLLFDVEAPMFNDIVDYANVSLLGLSGEDDEWSSSLSGNYSTYESDYYDPEEQAIVLKFVNIALNNIAHGGMVEINNDIYNPKGLFQNDDGVWTSLEEKMNTPRFVETYADLPKTSIENGIMAVAQESTYRSEPQITTKLDSYKKYRIVSVDEMTAETFNSIIEEVLPGYPSTGSIESGLYFMSTDGNQEVAIGLMRSPYNDTENLCGIYVSAFNYETDQEKRAAYFIELPSDFDTSEMFPPDKDSGERPEFNPELGKWYWCDIVEGDKDSYSVGGVHEGFPTDLPEELLFGYCEIYWDEEIYPAAVGEVTTYDSDPSNRKEIFSIDMKVFNFEDLSSDVTIVYPAGFYRYNNNEWVHVEDVSGGNFDNEDVLRSITATDIGNIQENTEKRHEHNNKSYLDQIQWDAIDKLNNQVPQNTNARHSHSNKSTLDKITEDTLSDIGNNTSQRHMHSNKVFLDSIDRFRTVVENHYVPLSRVSLKPNIITELIENGYTDCLTISSIPVGYSGISFRIGGDGYNIGTGRTMVKLPLKVCWEEGIYPPLEYFLQDTHAHQIMFIFYYDGYKALGKWYLPNDEVPVIDSRLSLGQNTSTKFAKVVNGEIEFAPLELANSFGDEDIYLSQGYKIVVGDNPYVVSQSLLPNDECEMRFKEFDDCILVYWVVTPRNSYLGDYINSSYITDFSYLFDGFDGEDISESGIVQWGELDTSNGYDFSYMFENCSNLKEIHSLNTNKANSMADMFKGCSSLKKVPSLNVSNVVNMNSMFSGCSSLEEIPDLTPNNCNYFENMFAGCTSLKKAPRIDISRANYLAGMFSGCSSLEEVPELNPNLYIQHANSAYTPTSIYGMFSGCSSLKTIGKVSFPYEHFTKVRTFLNEILVPSLENITIVSGMELVGNWDGLSNCPNLTVDSIMSFINAFVDNTGTETQYTLTIGADNLAKLTPEQIAVATNKNILLA